MICAKNAELTNWKCLLATSIHISCFFLHFLAFILCTEASIPSVVSYGGDTINPKMAVQSVERWDRVIKRLKSFYCKSESSERVIYRQTSLQAIASNTRSASQVTLLTLQNYEISCRMRAARIYASAFCSKKALATNRGKSTRYKSSREK